MHPARIRRSALPVALLLGLVCVAVLADTITVHPDGPPTADYATIQAAIAAADDGDCITVEPGTYVENIDFLGKAITVQSTDPLDPMIVASTIIDGSACTTGVDLCSVVTFGTDDTCVIKSPFSSRTITLLTVFTVSARTKNVSVVGKVSNVTVADVPV